MPNAVDGPMLVVSVVVDDAVVHGVMGGGLRGVVGESGHRILELGESMAAGVNVGEGTGPLFWNSSERVGARLRYEPARTSCLNAATGDEVAKANRPAARGELGVTGVDRPGEPSGGRTRGSW